MRRCKSTLFRGMEYSEDRAQIAKWAPAMMQGRDPQQKVAATRITIGTDVNFGEITRQLVTSLAKTQTFVCAPAMKCVIFSATPTAAGK